MNAADMNWARNVQSDLFVITLGAGGGQVVPFNQKRRSITFVPPQTGFVTLSTGSVPLANQGIVLSAGQAAIQLLIEEVGNIVQQSWFALPSAGGLVISGIDCNDGT